MSTVECAGHSDKSECDSPESSASQCSLAVVWLSLLLLHSWLLHVAGGLPQQEGETSRADSSSLETLINPPVLRLDTSWRNSWTGKTVIYTANLDSGGNLHDKDVIARS